MMSRWHVAPHRWNIVVWSIAIAAALTLLATSTALSATVYGIGVPAALLFSLLQALAIPGALVAPLAATAVALLSATALSALALPTASAPWPVSVVTIVAMSCTLGIAAWRTTWWVSAAGWGMAMLLAVIALSENASHATTVSAGAMTADLIVYAAITLISVGAGVLIRRWDSVRAQLVAERSLAASELQRRESAEEKARIARELHDVVAHGMSAIQVRAASARYRMPDLPEEAAAEFDDLAATARAAMSEMRVVLGLLRDETSTAERAPQPGFANLGELVERAQVLGPVTIEGAWHLTPSERGDNVLGVTVYRVVQEALSNVARHAPGAVTVISWTQTDDELRVQVQNGAGRSANAPRTDRGGQGLRGMRERVAALGGIVHTTVVGEGFLVRAEIPRTDRTEETA